MASAIVDAVSGEPSMTAEVERHARQRWEYRTLRYATGSEFEELAERKLNELGADGWEVAGFTRFQHKNENGYRVILKRPS